MKVVKVNQNTAVFCVHRKAFLSHRSKICPQAQIKIKKQIKIKIKK